MNTIKPFELGKSGVETDISGAYDWQQQRYQYAACRWGTNQYTRFGTNSGQYNFQDDSNTDNYSD